MYEGDRGLIPRDASKANKLAKIRRHASRVHFAKMHFGEFTLRKYSRPSAPVMEPENVQETQE